MDCDDGCFLSLANEVCPVEGQEVEEGESDGFQQGAFSSTVFSADSIGAFREVDGLAGI